MPSSLSEMHASRQARQVPEPQRDAVATLLPDPGRRWHRRWHNTAANQLEAGAILAARSLLDATAMTVDAKVILRNGLIGFALGMVVMLGISYGASTLGSSPPAAPASAR